MGEAELDIPSKTLVLHSHIITYGSATYPALTEQIRDEIETMWNEPGSSIQFDQQLFQLRFRITAACLPNLEELEVLQNDDPRNNYFRIEEYIEGNISFVDGLGCNTGFFMLENLYQGSTTAAHEYGHTLGLDHPDNIDIRGAGPPGIMYPRGTLVDAAFQYDPAKPAGVTGGTMHPMYRRVSFEDINGLKLHRLRFQNGKAVVGNFTNVYHWPHAATGDSV
ncbi:MAG: peptidase [Flaviaesturariibacter sp.]|nr:peptidase [Flaviaesturariibacter sp.]